MSPAASIQLRVELDAITNDHVPLVKHVPRIAALAEHLPHSIGARPTRPSPGFNCFAYAFGLHDQAAYTRIAAAEQRARGNRFFSNSKFADHLVRTNAVTPIGQRDLTPGDIVLYTQDQRIVHAARVIEGGSLQSKWGQGHLYVHHLWEVPARYGNTVRFFQKLGPEPYLPQFANFLRESTGWAEFAATNLSSVFPTGTRHSPPAK